MAGRNVKCYWWRGEPNFGDLLCPIILEHFCGVSVGWSDPVDAEIVSCGSVLDLLPESGYSGIVAGSGKLLEATALDLSQAAVWGVRGPMTLAGMILTDRDYRNMTFGDPGLLVSDLVNVERDLYDLGCVPHVTDVELFEREVSRARTYNYPEPILINPADDPLTVIRMIGSCRKIISSSLHGIVTADAFGIPRRTEMFSAMWTNPHEGGTFKFQDYGASLNQPIEFGTLQQAPENTVERIQVELFDMFTSLGRALNGTA